MQNKEHRKAHRMVRQNFMVSEYQIEMLRQISSYTGLSMSDLVRQGLKLVIGEYSNVISKKG